MILSSGSRASLFDGQQVSVALFTEKACFSRLKAFIFFFFFFWYYLTSEHCYSYNWSAGCTDNGLSHCHQQENEPCLWLIFTSRGPLMWSLPNPERCPPPMTTVCPTPPPPPSGALCRTCWVCRHSVQYKAKLCSSQSAFCCPMDGSKAENGLLSIWGKSISVPVNTQDLCCIRNSLIS